MASLSFVRSRKRWRVRWRATNRKSQVFSGSKVFFEKSQAVQFYAEIESQEHCWRTGRLLRTETIEAIKDSFFAYIKRHSPKTQIQYKRVITNFVESLPKSVLQAEQINPKHIQEYLYRLRDNGLKNRTINNHVVSIKSFCRYFSERSNTPNPATKIYFLKNDPPNVRFLAKAEYKKIISSGTECFSDRFRFIASTGLRAAEFSSLTWKSINGSLLTVTGKGRKRRTVPLNKTCQIILEKYRPHEYKHIFAPYRIRPNALYLQCKRLSRKLGVRRFGPHAFRHYCATELLLAGVPIAKVAKFLGHSITVCQNHYSHIIQQDLQGINDFLD